MRFLCIFLRFYAILCQKLQNFPQLFAKSCERPCKNFVLVFDFVAVSQNSPAKSRFAPIRSARRGAAAAGRGTERTPSRTPERTPSRRECAVWERVVCYRKDTQPNGTAAQGTWRRPKGHPAGHPAGHPKGHPAAGSMVLWCVLIVCGVLPKGHPTEWHSGARNVAPPERTPSRTPSRTPERTPSRREYGVGVCSDSWWCVMAANL